MFANFPIVFVAGRKSLETYPYHRSLRLSSSPLMVQDLYSQRRHEFGDNSISRLLPSSWRANATQEGRREEILGMRDILRKWGNVKAEDVKGYRARYIQVGVNMEFKVLKDEGFLYESSMPTQKFMNPPLSIAQFRIVKFSALWDSLAYSNIAVLARPTAQVPSWAGNVFGVQVQFLGDFGLLVYPPSGDARQSHCTPALLNILMSFGHCTDHCTSGSVAGDA